MAKTPDWIHLIGGGTGATLGAAVTNPLEVIKTRLQSQQYGARSGLMSTFQELYQREGAKALFKGLLPNLIGIAPSRAIYFYTYNKLKRNLGDMLGRDSKRVHALSAALSGMTVATVTNPIWVVKTHMQLQSETKENMLKQTKRSFLAIYESSGIRGLYRGLTASYVGTIESAIQFVIYEMLKKKYLGPITNVVNDKATPENLAPDSAGSASALKVMLIAGASKLSASVLTYPHEVARTRLREANCKYKSFVDVIFTVARQEGFRGLYGGMGTHLLRVLPNTAIMFVTYEAVVYTYMRHNHT